MEKTTLTYQEILNAFDAFGNDLAKVHLGVNLTLYVVRNIEELRGHQETYQNTLQTIFNEYGEEVEDENGAKQMVVPNDRLEEFVEERKELINKEVEVEFEQINLSELSDKEREKLDDVLTPKILSGIKYTIKDF